MADLAAQIETMETAFMRAWASGHGPTIKALTGRGFELVIGTRPAVMLDRPSWLDAASGRFTCHAFRFGDVYVRDLGGVALFAAQLELKASLDGRDWSGPMWVTDLWKKGRVRRRWRLAQRMLSRVEDDKHVKPAIQAMQLWR